MFKCTSCVYGGTRVVYMFTSAYGGAVRVNWWCYLPMVGQKWVRYAYGGAVVTNVVGGTILSYMCLWFVFCFVIFVVVVKVCQFCPENNLFIFKFFSLKFWER